MYDLRPVAEKIQKADAILIGASNGLSMTEGLHLFADNQAFENLFGDFKDKYGTLRTSTAFGACCMGWEPAGLQKK